MSRASVYQMFFQLKILFKCPFCGYFNLQALEVLLEYPIKLIMSQEMLFMVSK